MELSPLSHISDLARARIMKLSLKFRLGIILGGLMALSVLMAAGLMYQHRITINGAEQAVHAYETTSVAIHMREILSDLDLEARARTKKILQEGRNSERQRAIEEFQKLEEHLSVGSFSSETRQSLDEIRKNFDLYTKASENNRFQYYQMTERATDELVQASEKAMKALAEKLHENQRVSDRLRFMVICAFIFITFALMFSTISHITHPISEFVDFLDRVNFEEGIPEELPGMKSQIPEVAHLALGFKRLFQRLQGYRTLNYSRLLIEKRRADIIAASISDGIFLLRGEEILYVNPTGEKILGLGSGASVKGLRVGEGGSLLNLSGKQAVMKAISCTLPVEHTLEVDDRKFYFLIQSFPISYDLIEQVESATGGEPEGGMEQLLEGFQANTLVLAQDVTLVREGQEAKSHFLATLSHEVKTPVTSLTMATRLLKRAVNEIPNSTHRSLVLTCAEDVDRLRGLLEDLMSVSRFDTLTQKIAVQRVDLAKLLIHSVQSFRIQADHRGIELSHQISNQGKPIIVSVDAPKIAWALSNLLTNALRHTPRGGKVEACLVSLGDRVEVRVRDTGPGIDRFRQERIFDKFNPYYDLRVARSGSVGVGLAIAREIVVAHGGSIWVSSETGKGAEFCFSLPFKRCSSSEVAERCEVRALDEVRERFGVGEKNRFSF